MMNDKPVRHVGYKFETEIEFCLKLQSMSI